MKFYWVYDLPHWLFGTLTIAAFVSFSMLGLWIFRHFSLRMFGKHSQNDIVSFYLSTAGVFYGITLGLISVGTYTTFSSVDDAVSKEAASMAALYRDVSSFPEPAGGELRQQLKVYAGFVIDVEWPLQKKGKVKPDRLHHLGRLLQTLAAFKPSDAREELLDAEALRQFNQLATLTAMRQQSVKGGLPATMYVVILFGAVLNIVISWLLVVDNFRLHALLNALMAALLGLLVFLIAAMDRPFRGEYCIEPTAFELVQHRLMERKDVKTPPQKDPSLEDVSRRKP